MSPENYHEFDQNINQLIVLLKKILKNIPDFQAPLQGGIPGGGEDNASQINLFFTFLLPMLSEDFEGMEEAYEQYLSQEESAPDFSKDLTPQDLEFLRRHGIRF